MAFKGESNDVVVLCVGRTGTGRSKFIKRLCGHGRGWFSRLFLGTQTTTIEPVRIGNLVLVDTPGYDYQEDVDFKKLLNAWFSDSHYDEGLSISTGNPRVWIVFFRDILKPKEARGDEPDDIFKKVLKVQANCGRVIFVTSRWNAPTEEVDATKRREDREVMLREKWKAEYCGNQDPVVKRFDKTQRSAVEIAKLFGWH